MPAPDETQPDAAARDEAAPALAEQPPRDPAGRVDYGSMYDDYWSRDDRWGSDSFADADEVVADLLTTCGGGRTLDVGCGMGVLVRTLLREGVDAHGVDVARRPIERANTLAPGRFRTGSILDLPFDDDAFDTVTSTDVLEHIEEGDVPRALAELFRVTRRSAFIRLATTPDRDRRWHLAIRDRAWWEERFFEAGFARHSLAQRVVSFEAIDHEPWQITLVLEKPPAFEPPAGLRAQDQLLAERHRDIPRERSRAAEAATERTLRAAAMTRPGDTVLDLSGGLGWSSAILAHASQARRVIGLDPDAAIVEAARARNASLAGLVEHRVGSASDLSFLEDRSVHAIVAQDVFPGFGPPELAELRRVLTPGGRVIVGGDASAHTVDALLGALGEGFMPERAWSQQLGRDAERPERAHEGERETTDDEPEADDVAEPDAGEPRRTVLHSPDEDGRLSDPDAADRVLIVFSLDPLGADKAGYRETSYPDLAHIEGFHVGNYARDHDNPWLLPSMISMGMRSPERTIVESIARRTLDAARPGSPDEGAALCVLAYRLLDDDDPEPKDIDDLLTRLEAFDARADDSTHAWRWRISNRYARGLLHLARGEQERAHDAFLACAELDVLRFSPLLASKTCDALFQAGLLDAQAGRTDRARAHWRRALDETHRVLHADWLNVWGDPDTPMPFGLPDLATLVELASRCANALLWLDDWNRRPGLAWNKSHHRTLAEHRRRVEKLTEVRTWLDRERGRLRTAFQRQRDYSDRLAEQRDALLATRTRLEERIEHLQSVADQRAEALEKQGQTIERLSATREELRAFTTRQASTIADLNRTIAELRADGEQLRERLRAAGGATRESVEALRGKIESSESARRDLLKALESREETIGSLKKRVEELSKGREWLSEQRRAALSQLESLRKEFASARAGVGEKLAEREKPLRERLASLEAAIGTRNDAIENLQSALKKKSEAHAWLESQRDAALERARQAADRHATLLESVERLTRANESMRTKHEAHAAQVASRDEQIGTLRAQIERLGTARDWLEQQRTAARAHAEKTAEAVQSRDEQLAEILASRQAEHAETRKRLTEASARIKKLAEAVATRDERIKVLVEDSARVRKALRWNADKRQELLEKLRGNTQESAGTTAETASNPTEPTEPTEPTKTAKTATSSAPASPGAVEPKQATASETPPAADQGPKPDAGSESARGPGDRTKPTSGDSGTRAEPAGAPDL